jgi:hypothetical protein
MVLLLYDNYTTIVYQATPILNDVDGVPCNQIHIHHFDPRFSEHRFLSFQSPDNETERTFAEYLFVKPLSLDPGRLDHKSPIVAGPS